MIDGVDVNIVHIKMDVAIGLAGNGVEKLDFAHFGQRAVRVVGGVFHGDAHFQHVLHGADACGGVAHHFPGEGQRQQVVNKAVVVAIAQVLGKKADAVAADKVFNLFEKIYTQRIAAAQRQRQAVAGKRKTFGHAVEIAPRRAAHPQPVFGGGFDEINTVRIGQAVAEIRRHAAFVAESGALQNAHICLLTIKHAYCKPLVVAWDKHTRIEAV